MSDAEHLARSDVPTPEGGAGREAGRGQPPAPPRPGGDGTASGPGDPERTAPEPGQKREGGHAEGKAPTSRGLDDASPPPPDERTWFLRPFRRKGKAATFAWEVRSVPPGAPHVEFSLQHRDVGEDLWTGVATIGPFVSPGLTILEVTGLKEELRLAPNVVGCAEGGWPRVRFLPPRWRP